MLPLNIQNDLIYFKDIKPVNLPQILNWYNKVDDFKFATGIDSPITLDILTRKYAEVAISKGEFFVGIYIKKEEKMIGILKGSLKYENKDSAWISSIVIDPEYQNKGYGKSAIDLLLDHLKTYCKTKQVFLAVIEDNLQGMNFWIKQHFKELRKMQNHIKLQDRKQDVIIMHKSIM